MKAIQGDSTKTHNNSSKNVSSTVTDLNDKSIYEVESFDGEEEPYAD